MGAQAYERGETRKGEVMSQSRSASFVFCVALATTLGAGLVGASDTEALPAADWLIATVK